MKANIIHCIACLLKRASWLLMASLIACQVERIVDPNDPNTFITDDDRMVAMAYEVPGFGGMFFDSQSRQGTTDLGPFTVYLKGDSWVQSMRVPLAVADKISAVLIKIYGEDLSQRSSSSEMVFLEGQYDTIQLAQWHARVQLLFAIKGVTLTDLDEGSNRVTVGVETEDLKTSVRDGLLLLGIPLEAVVIEITGPIVEL